MEQRRRRMQGNLVPGSITSRALETVNRRKHRSKPFTAGWLFLAMQQLGDPINNRAAATKALERLAQYGHVIELKIKAPSAKNRGRRRNLYRAKP